MKKTLRSLALAAMAAIPVIAGAQLNVKTVWCNGVEDGVANNIPGLDAGWNKPTAAGGTTTDTRFATGKDGKFFINNHKTNEIQSYDGKNFATVLKLPTVTAEVWNGTALSTDDAGNIILNFGFTDPTVSVTNWAVITNGVLTEVKLSTPLVDLNLKGRLDIISHIVGDVTSEKGGIGYSTIQKTDHLVMFHFKGDGSKVTSVTAKASSAVDGIAEYYAKQTETYQAAPKLTNIDDLLASAKPEDEFYLALGQVGPGTEAAPGFDAGNLVNCGAKIGNRGYGSVATVTLDGETYIIRNYVADDNANAELLTNWKSIMQFGVFKLDGTCVATWTGSTYTNGNGCETFSIEMVDDKTANIYLYVSTPSADTASGTVAGCYAAMVKVSTEEIVDDTPDGTANKPYEIATVEDLCNAWKKVQANQAGMTYFVQTADIDLAGVTDWHPINGFNGTYTAAINYDGQNHLIKNFSPEVVAPDAASANYYMGTVFGVLTGTVKNLGIVDADVKNYQQGGGFLAAYAGHANAKDLAPKTVIENVFVTGNYDASENGNYIGGIAGTTNTDVEIINCFVNANIKAQNNVGGFIGRLRNALKVEESYVAGTISANGDNVALVVASDRTGASALTVTANNVVAFNTGVEAAVVNAVLAKDSEVVVATEDTKQDLIDEILDFWTGYTDEYPVYGLPGLEGFEYVPAETVEPDGTEAHPFIIATVQDLCDAYLKVKANPTGVTYFKQTADIDMDGVTDWHAINGFNGTYTAAINYDGQNHLIKKFSPTVNAAGTETDDYYRGSIFGVLTGTVKNLGIVDADIVNAVGQGGGFLAAYAGHANAKDLAPKTVIENVFVTGNYDASENGNYIGGIAGTTNTDVEIINCFVNANIKAQNNVGGFIGRLRNALKVEESYVAGTISANGDNVALVVASDKTGASALTVTANNVVAFNTGVEADVVNAVLAKDSEVVVATEDTKQDLIDEIYDFWTGYTDEYPVYGLPGLEGFTYTVDGDGPTSGIEGVAVVETEAPAVYYNLQGVQVANPENGLYIVRRGNKVTKELICK